MKFKLLDLFGGAISRVCMCSGQNGKGYTCAHYVFEPGKIYETDDPTLMKYIKGEIGDVMEQPILTDSLKEDLRLGGIKYTVKRCSTCTGSKPHAVFNPFEIIEEEDSRE